MPGAWRRRKSRKQWLEPLGELACHAEGETAERWLVRRHQNGDFRKIDVFKDLIFVTVRSEITRCREKIKKATEELNEEKIKLESKVLKCRACKLSLEKACLNLTFGGYFTV